jgi:acyl carrier protein
LQLDEIYNGMQEVFDEVFMQKVLVKPELTAKDVDEWDSLQHVSLILSIEQKFKIRFRVGEVEGTKNVGDLAALIEKRLGQK